MIAVQDYDSQVEDEYNREVRNLRDQTERNIAKTLKGQRVSFSGLVSFNGHSWEDVEGTVEDVSVDFISGVLASRLVKNPRVQRQIDEYRYQIRHKQYQIDLGV